jgi:NitT/TauT family transport system substrate-binding protein
MGEGSQHRGRIGRCVMRMFLLLACLGAVLVAGCGGDDDSGGGGGGGGGSAAAPEEVSLRMNFAFESEQLGFFVAQQKGWYKDAGLDVTLRESPGSNVTAKLVAAGKETFGFLSGDALLSARASGADLVSVGSPVQDAGAGIAYRTDSDIKEPKDLEGHSYGDIPGTNTFALLPVFLEKAGVDKSQVKVVSLTYSNFATAYWSGKVDTVLGNDYLEPFYSQDGKIPTDFFLFRDYGVPTAGWGIVVKRDALDEKAETVRKFVQASMKGWEYAYANPKEAHALAKELLGRKYPLSEEASIVGLERLAQHTANTEGKPLGWQSEEDWATLAQVLGDVGYLKGDAPEASTLFTNEFVK